MERGEAQRAAERPAVAARDDFLCGSLRSSALSAVFEVAGRQKPIFALFMKKLMLYMNS